MRTSNYNFDIDKHSLIKPVVIIRSGDHDIDTIKITLSNQGDPVDLTKATVTFMGTTPAGNKIIDDVHVKIVDATTGIFEYTFPSAAGASVGEYQDAYFSIILGNGQTSTMNFRIQVLSGVDISAPAASEYITHYDTMVTALNSAYDSFVNETDDKMASTVSSLATSAATVLDSALARVNNVNSTANSASSAASKAVSMASSVASTVTSQASYINSVASSAASSVSSVAAGVVDKLNNISVGGRNLLLGTKDFSAISWKGQAAGEYTVTPNAIQGLSSANYSKQWGGPKYLLSDLELQITGKNIDTLYIASAWVKNTGTNPVSLGFYSDFISPQSFDIITVPAGSDWIRIISKPFKFKKTSGLSGTIQFSNSIAVQGGVIQQAGTKLEIGNIATDWTPAPEDVANAYVKKSGDTVTGTLAFKNGVGMKFGEAEFGYDGASDEDGGNGGLYLKNKSSASVTGGIKHHISPVVVYPSNYLNMDTVTQTGTFLIRGRGAVIAPIFGVPTNFTTNFEYGTLTVEANGAIAEPNQAAIDAGLTVRALTDAREIFRTDAATPRTWVRNRQGAGVWSPWREVDGDVLRFSNNPIWFGGNAQISRTGNIIHMQLVWNKTGGVIVDTIKSNEKLPEWAWPVWSTMATVRYGEKYRGEVEISNDGTLNARGAIAEGSSRVNVSYAVDKPWPHSPLNPNNVPVTLYPSNWTTEEIAKNEKKSTG